LAGFVVGAGDAASGAGERDVLQRSAFGCSAESALQQLNRLGIACGWNLLRKGR